jgi:hypothetical protein
MLNRSSKQCPPKPSADILIGWRPNFRKGIWSPSVSGTMLPQSIPTGAAEPPIFKSVVLNTFASTVSAPRVEQSPPHGVQATRDIYESASMDDPPAKSPSWCEHRTNRRPECRACSYPPSHLPPRRHQISASAKAPEAVVGGVGRLLIPSDLQSPRPQTSPPDSTNVQPFAVRARLTAVLIWSIHRESCVQTVIPMEADYRTLHVHTCLLGGFDARLLMPSPPYASTCYTALKQWAPLYPASSA